jgi:glycosyltransferase involved in cell wall biosynthesis
VRVCFLVAGLSPSGGTATVLRHARDLRESGQFEPELVITGEVGDASAAPPGVPVRVLAEVTREAYDVAVATWWQTASTLYELQATRRCVFLQSIEHRFYEENDLFERQGAACVLGLPLDYIAVAPWMRRLLTELRPGVRCHLVPNGIDKATFVARSRPVRSGPLRVLVEGQPGLWFKGVDESLRAVRAMREPHELTLACLDPRNATGVEADRVVGGLDPAGMASLYAESDVLVKLGRVEGLGLAPLEGFHTGLPCVVTPYTGHEEYVVHGQNGLVTGFDDEAGTAAALDLLARDRDLLARLSASALATARSWPDEAESSRAFVRALSAIATDVPPGDGGLAVLHRTLAFHAAQGRLRLGAGNWARDRLERLQEEYAALSASRDECSRMLAEAESHIAEITGSKGYRALAASRRLADRVRR